MKKKEIKKCSRFLKGGALQEKLWKEAKHRLCPQNSVCKLIRSLTDKHSPSGTLASFINYFFFCLFLKSKFIFLLH